MNFLLAFSNWVDKVSSVIGKYAIWLIFAATFISALNAIIRKIFSYSSNSFLEVQWYLYAWSFLLAASITLLRRAHVRIDVINSRLSKKKRLWIDIVGFSLFLTPFCIFILYVMIPLVWQMYQTSESSANSDGLIRWPVWLAIPVGFILLMLQGWSELIKRIAYLKGVVEYPAQNNPTQEDSAMDLSNLDDLHIKSSKNTAP